MFIGIAVLMTGMTEGAQTLAATTAQIGDSGKTYASSGVSCAAAPTSGIPSPFVEAGLFNPKNNTRGTVSLNGAYVASVTAAEPGARVWLVDNLNTVVVALGRKVADVYEFSVQPGLCELPNTSDNTFSADHTLEYAASGKSYATVIPGCALNGSTGQVQPYVHLFDNGDYLLNVSLNGQALTQLSASRPHVPVFLGPGQNVISAANGYVSVDYYVRDGGDGTCTLP